MERNFFKTVTLPDGKEPLPLGSGYIVGLIGSGAMSNVYKIWNPQLETFHAVKLMKPDLSSNSRQRFQTEMKIMAALSHPNIIEIHSVGEWNGLSFIEMEFIDGFTLAEIIEKNGALPIPVCTALGMMIAQALTFAHDKDYSLFGKSFHGIIHRDIKPSNLMVTKEGIVKLMDFGIARPVETSLMTMDGAVMGTMQYLAPEQIDGKNVGVVADIYALGVVLYECLSGRKAFPQCNLSQLMAAKMDNDFIPLISYRIKIPRTLINLVGKCMMQDAKKRLQSAAIAVDNFEQAHYRLTQESPERIIRALLNSPAQGKIELTVHKSFHIRFFSFFIAGAVIIVAILMSPEFLKKPDRKSLAVSTKLHVQNEDKSKMEKSLFAPGTPLSQKKKIQPAESLASQPAPMAHHLKGDGKSFKLKPPDAVQSDTALKDLSETFEKEARSGHYERALALFGKLPKSSVAQLPIQLLWLRTLVSLGKTEEAGNFLAANTLNDGEFFLIKAKYLFGRNDIDEALNMLEKCIAIHALLLDADVVRREYLYYRALCLSRRFDQVPTMETGKKALDGWFEVKNSLRTIPSHLYFEKAVSEMQRIGDALRELTSNGSRNGARP
jgi:serine/threonine protein kinase